MTEEIFFPAVLTITSLSFLRKLITIFSKFFSSSHLKSFQTPFQYVFYFKKVMMLVKLVQNVSIKYAGESRKVLYWLKYTLGLKGKV